LLIKQRSLVVTYIIYDVVFDTPFDEIQLRQCRMNFMRCSRDVVCKFFRPTKRIKEFFRISIETRFIGAMHREILTVMSLEGRVILFRVVGYEPF